MHQEKQSKWEEQGLERKQLASCAANKIIDKENRFDKRLQLKEKCVELGRHQVDI